MLKLTNLNTIHGLESSSTNYLTKIKSLELARVDDKWLRSCLTNYYVSLFTSYIFAVDSFQGLGTARGDVQPECAASQQFVEHRTSIRSEMWVGSTRSFPHFDSISKSDLVLFICSLLENVSSWMETLRNNRYFCPSHFSNTDSIPLSSKNKCIMT